MISALGRYSISWLVFLIEISLLSYATLRTMVTSRSQGWRPVFGVIASQVYFTGWQALPVILIIGLSIGFLFVSQSVNAAFNLGNFDNAMRILLGVVLRELAPLLTSLIVIARSGTAVASELGNMKVNREVDSLISMGINPLNFIVLPRLIGGGLSVFVLGCYFALFGFLGGMLGAFVLGRIPPTHFLTTFLSTVQMSDFLILGVKLFMSGFFVFAISSYQGLQAQKSPTEVPVVTTQAVMKSIIIVIGVNIIISLLFYINEFKKMGVLQ